MMVNETSKKEREDRRKRSNRSHVFLPGKLLSRNGKKEHTRTHAGDKGDLSRGEGRGEEKSEVASSSSLPNGGSILWRREEREV